VESFFADIADTRLRRKKSGPFLREHEKQEGGRFGGLKLNQMVPELRTEVGSRINPYKPGAFPLNVSIKQLDTVRHDAAPLERRNNLPNRIGVTAIVNRIVVDEHP
jgi:hypothetical protein